MYFVHRSGYDGPLSKRVVRLPDSTVLGWFQRVWSRPEPRDWIRAELGDVYGFATIFEAAEEHKLPCPSTTDELRALLHEHLYVEGEAADFIRLDEHSLRVRTDDDEIDVAYFFFDDEILAAARKRRCCGSAITWRSSRCTTTRRSAISSGSCSTPCGRRAIQRSRGH